MNKELSTSPLVSVLMPVYNGETTIIYAINSLLKQTWMKWECIIVNDGSTDNTSSILHKIVDKRFVIIELTKNEGRGKARQLALEHAKGDYIAYLDADDMIHSNKILIQVQFLESHKDIDMVGCGGITINKALSPLQLTCLTDIPKSGKYHYGRKLPLLMASVMIRAKYTQGVSYNHKLDVGEDFEYFSRYLDKKYYANIPMPFYYYLIGEYTKKKILTYHFRNLCTYRELINNGAIKEGLFGLLSGAIKLICYSVLLTIFSVNKIMTLRGNGEIVNDDEKRIYQEQIKKFVNSDSF